MKGGGHLLANKDRFYFTCENGQYIEYDPVAITMEDLKQFKNGDVILQQIEEEYKTSWMRESIEGIRFSDVYYEETDMVYINFSVRTKDWEDLWMIGVQPDYPHTHQYLDILHNAECRIADGAIVLENIYYGNRGLTSNRNNVIKQPSHFPY